MNLDRKSLTSWLVVSLLLLTGLASACGDSSSNPNGGSNEAGAADGGRASDPGGGDSGGVDAKAGEPALGGTSAQGGAEPAGAGSNAGGVDAGPSCSLATFPSDCPAVECQLVSGCAQGVCQYTPLKVCVSRLARGTFVPAIADATVGGLTLHGNLAPFRFQDGPVCQGTTCLTGGITP
jgi:hypothetical protein